MGKAKEVEDVVTAESADQAVPRRILTQGIGQRTVHDATLAQRHTDESENNTGRRRETCIRLRPRPPNIGPWGSQTDREGKSQWRVSPPRAFSGYERCGPRGRA